MNAAADRLDFVPPADRRWGRPLLLALTAHALLVAALTWGVRWQSDAVQPAVEAELWSRLPQLAAPRAVEPEPAPPTPPTPPAPRTDPPPPRPTPSPGPTQAEIAVQARQKAEEARRQQAQAEQRERERLAAERRAAEVQRRQEAARRAEEQRREAQQAAERQQNLERMLGQAGASGGATARGAATQSSGPSASYLGRIVARIKPNIVFTDVVGGNPRAEVEVRLLPDGTIANSRLTQSSGNRAWDDAVLRAVERTGSLPRDENGRVPSSLVIGFRPND